MRAVLQKLAAAVGSDMFVAICVPFRFSADMERLDVEDDERRQRRIQNYLEKLDASSSTRISSPPLKFDFGDRTTSLTAPPTELLARVQAFLPKIEASNTILEQQAKADPCSVNMEHVDDSMAQYIEMNLGLGVFEDKSYKKRTLGGDSDRNDVEMPSGSRSSTLSSSDSSSPDDNDDDGYGSDSSSADTEFSSEIITSFSAAPRIIRPLPKRSPASRLNPIIQVLGENTSDVERQTADA
ncbi:hypothetical protein F5887DRAFT_963199 [Amanita rubescens]|nr:hypothetical protein F5887DRAFT_963199 [Amanita rubescens]